MIIGYFVSPAYRLNSKAFDMVKPVNLALVGIGKIARDQHLPSIAANPDFALQATVSRNAAIDGIRAFHNLEALLVSNAAIDAVALCTPPSVRFDMAWQALSTGKHVLLEKPPGATLSEVETLQDLAAKKGLTLYATWHSRHAAAVEMARDWLSHRRINAVQITWCEDVRRWHPGQDWIWQAGNLGVFDPGINALSILTRILPAPVHLSSADLDFPSNCQTPIAARLRFLGPDNADISAEFNWLHTGDQTWDIAITTDAGTLLLSEGGSKMAVDGTPVPAPKTHEYAAIYQRFSTLIKARESDVDLAPLRHVADAFLLGQRHQVAPFYETQNDL